MVSHNGILWVLGCAPISDPIKSIIEGSSKKTRDEEEKTKSRTESKKSVFFFFFNRVVQLFYSPAPTSLVPRHLYSFGRASVSLPLLLYFLSPPSICILTESEYKITFNSVKTKTRIPSQVTEQSQSVLC